MYNELWKSKDSTLIVHFGYQCDGVRCKQAFRCVWLVDSSLLFCCIALVQKQWEKVLYLSSNKRKWKERESSLVCISSSFVCSAHSSGSWSIRCWRMVFIRKKMKVRQLLIYWWGSIVWPGFGFWLYRTTKQLDVCHIMVNSIRPHWAPIGCRVVWLLDE